jgi:hypothetical protein
MRVSQLLILGAFLPLMAAADCTDDANPYSPPDPPVHCPVQPCNPTTPTNPDAVPQGRKFVVTKTDAANNNTFQRGTIGSDAALQPITIPGTQFGHLGLPSPTADGKDMLLVAVRPQDPSDELFIVGIDGGVPTHVPTKSASCNYDVDIWDADANPVLAHKEKVAILVAFGSPVAGRHTLGVCVGTTSGGFRLVLKTAALDITDAEEAISWSEDGTEIIVVINETGGDQIAFVGEDGSMRDYGNPLPSHTDPQVQFMWGGCVYYTALGVNLAERGFATQGYNRCGPNGVDTPFTQAVPVGTPSIQHMFPATINNKFVVGTTWPTVRGEMPDPMIRYIDPVTKTTVVENRWGSHLEAGFENPRLIPLS